MNLDIEDILTSAIASFFGRFFLFLAAVWLGCIVGAASVLAGRMAEMQTWKVADSFRWMWGSPIYLLSPWAFLNIPFLLFCLIRFIRDEGDDFLTWGIVAGVQAVMVACSWAGWEKHGWMPLAAAWLTLPVLLFMMGTGIWLIRQHLTNIWARNLGILRAEIALKEAIKEEAQTEQFDVEIRPGSISESMTESRGK